MERKERKRGDAREELFSQRERSGSDGCICTKMNLPSPEAPRRSPKRGNTRRSIAEDRTAAFESPPSRKPSECAGMSAVCLSAGRSKSAPSAEDLTFRRAKRSRRRAKAKRKQTRDDRAIRSIRGIIRHFAFILFRETMHAAKILEGILVQKAATFREFSQKYPFLLYLYTYVCTWKKNVWAAKIDVYIKYIHIFLNILYSKLNKMYWEKCTWNNV